MFFLSQNDAEKQQKVQKGPKVMAKPVSNKAQVSI